MSWKLAQLLSRLTNQSVLLVVDNVEHLLDGVSALSIILQRASRVRILATSRERLNLQGEWLFELHGLPVPAPGQYENLNEYSSVALFVQNASRAKVGFTLRPEDYPDVARICQLVDGMPLGIELAATWVRALSCRKTAQEIEHDLDFLTACLRDVPERHRSLRAVFDHSWRLLVELTMATIGLGDLRRAVRLFATAMMAAAAIGTPLSDAKKQRISEPVRAVLGESVFSAEWEKGRGLTLEQAVAYTLRSSDAGIDG